MTNSIKVLDVTLRDGGCVNNFNFGQPYMEQILAAQERSGVEIIELGYLDDKGSFSGRTQWASIDSISRSLLKEKKKGITYVAMMDYGKFSLGNIVDRKENFIDGIRLAFHKKKVRDIFPIAKEILRKGYRLYLQPMLTVHYSENELLELIGIVNSELPEVTGFYIVDSFGEMRSNDLSRLFNIIESNLNQNILLGFHSHNNLQLAYSNACALLQFPMSRDVIIDSSIMGMGKGAGNLNTELMLEHLNIFYGKHYKIAPLLEVMDCVINQLRSEFSWGYAPEYYLSSSHHCSPTYASYYYNKHMLPIDQVGELLSHIDENKKISFDKSYAEELYRSYNETKPVDDSICIKDLRDVLHGRDIIVLAPGKSIQDYHDRIGDFQRKEGVITIGLNLTLDYHTDFLVVTRLDLLGSAVSSGRTVITTSNVSKSVRGDVKILNYGRWIEIRENVTYDSSSVICLNMLQYIGVKSVALAGFDGFSVNINDNYADPIMRRPVTEEQSIARNLFYKQFIADKKSAGMNINFLTPSLYE